MRPPRTSLAIMIAVAVIFPMAAFSQDQKKDEKKSQGGEQHGGGGKLTQQAAPRAATPQGHVANGQHHQEGGATAPSQQIQVSHHSNIQPSAPQRSYSGGNASHGQQKHAQGVSPQIVSNSSSVKPSYRAGGSTVSPQIVRSGNGGGGGYQGQVAPNAQYNSGNGGGHQGRGGGYAGQVTPNSQYNSGNNYGGNWYPANTHNDWNQNGQYYWNNHNYRWYQGGWLIIDTGFNPYYVTTGYSGYSNNGSVVSSVQAALANQGYYNGPVDGMMGRGTRRAIANYQGDHNLNVTGRINGDLLQSLQIQ